MVCAQFKVQIESIPEKIGYIASILEQINENNKREYIYNKQVYKWYFYQKHPNDPDYKYTLFIEPVQFEGKTFICSDEMVIDFKKYLLNIVAQFNCTFTTIEYII